MQNPLKSCNLFHLLLSRIFRWALGALVLAAPGLSHAALLKCEGVLVGLRPRIERLFGVPVKVFDAALEVRERTVGDLKVVPLQRIFSGDDKVLLGFGLPNVFTTIPDDKDGYEKFAAKSLRREDAKVEDTRGFVQSGIFLHFENLPDEAIEALQVAIRDPKNHTRHWTCVNANCQIFQQAGFHLKDGEPLDEIYFPVHLLRTLIRDGLYYKGQRVSFKIVRTAPDFLQWYGVRQIWSEVDTLRRHARKANPVLGKVLYSLDPFFGWALKKLLPQAPPPDPWMKDTPISDLAAAQAAQVKVRVSSTSTSTSLLTQLWGAHNLYEVETSARANIDQYLPNNLKEFDRPNKDLFTLLKQHLLFSPGVVHLLRRALVKSVVDLGPQSVAELHSMLPVHSQDHPAQFNLVVTPESMTIAYLNAGKSKTVDWLLTKHVLISGYAANVRFAGLIWKGDDGTIYVSNDSGTYRPNDDDVDRIVDYLRLLLPGVNIEGIKMPRKPAVTAATPPKPSKISEIFQKLKGFDLAYFKQQKMIREIESAAGGPKKIQVALKDLESIHDMEGVSELKTLARAQVFVEKQEAILSAGFLSLEEQQKLAPSKGSMRAVRDRKGHYIVFDGNGRLKALQQAFKEKHPDLKIEVETFETDSPSIHNALEWIRSYRGL